MLVYFGYAIWAFRERNPDVVVDGPPIRGNSSVQFWWLIVTTALVLFLAGYGTVRLLADGSGGGQGPNPIATPAPPRQQAAAGAGGRPAVAVHLPLPGLRRRRDPRLELPANTPVVFNVTSLDVIHSFWAYQLGVKADANPGVNNIAYVTTRGPLTFNVRCAELCGLWHGYMFNSGQVVPKSQFASWIAQQQQQYAPATKNTAPYSKTYFPQPVRRGG